MKKQVIVGGKAYTDIDVLACAAAYKQLICLLGKSAVAVVSPTWNQTIPSQVRTWEIDVQSTLNSSLERCVFIPVDVSDPLFFYDCVEQEKVIEIFDHHFGHEQYWRNKLGDKCHIEKVGACATLIWEQFKRHGLENKILNCNANLLYTAIFANTLNFRSQMTNERDIIAFEEVRGRINLSKDWIEQYYEQVQKSILDNISLSLSQDSKKLNNLGRSLIFGQLELWDARPAIDSKAVTMPDRKSGDSIINVVSIAEGKSYLVVNSPDLEERLMKITDGQKLRAGLLLAPRLWQRKELIKELLV